MSANAPTGTGGLSEFPLSGDHPRMLANATTADWADGGIYGKAVLDP